MTPIDIAKFEQLKATGDLPSPKGAALAIMRMSQRDDFPMAELAHAVSSDPAFVGRLIKSANSAGNIGQRPVASVTDALKVVGVSAVRALALSLSLLSSFKAGSCRNFDYQGFWSHSLVRGIALQALMFHARAIPPDEAFSVGLLARVGDLALATLFAADYSRLLAEADDRAHLCKLEREAFALTHSQLTAAMLQDWGFPRTFIEPVLFYEDQAVSHFDEGTRWFVLVHALRLADYIADICLAPESVWQEMMPQLFLLGEKISLGGEMLMTLCDQVTKDWLDWGVMLQVETRSMPSFDVLAKPPVVMLDGGETPSSVLGDAALHVMLAEGDGERQGSLRSVLEGAGYMVSEADSGQQAFELALELRPSLLVVASALPRMSGLELTRSLRDTVVGRDAYILMLSPQGNDELMIDAFAAGVDDIILGAASPEVLLARLRAGHRVVKLNQEVAREREDVRRFTAELAVAHRRLQQVARTDSLTGFPNRCYAMERLQQEWKAAERGRHALSCMVVDVDGFKQINDRHGHDVGDAVLRHGATALKEGLRAQDVICRTGGDEFLIICPDTELAAAVQCAERVRHAAERAELVIAGCRIPFRVSIGVAMRDDSMADVDALIRRAGQGADKAKGLGRNCVVAM